MEEKTNEIVKEKQQIPEENSKNEKNVESTKQKKKPIITVIVLTFIILAIAILSTIFALLNNKNDKIISGISIFNIDVSNMSKEEAKNKVKENVGTKLAEDIILKFDNYETTLNPSQVSAQFNIDKAVEEAYGIGRDSNIFVNNYSIIATKFLKKNIDLNLEYDNTLLDNKINDISSKLPNARVQSSYYIEDEDLIIVKGTAGNVINKEKFKEELISEIRNINKKNIIELPINNAEPDEIDLEKIRKEIYKVPVNAYVKKDPFEVHTHINGVDFGISIEEAKKIIEKDEKEYEIPLKITVADITLADLGAEAFPDKLSHYTTNYNTGDYNRTTNVELSAKKISGTIILPGEIFSYNQVVGERTISKGYKEAAAYAGGKIVQSIGGGICQTSSTLYNAALLANLEITDRSNHLFETSYVEPSRDATVSWGTLDFQFKNTRKFPIKVVTDVGGGVLDIAIYGVKEDVEYDVSIESIVTSYIPFTVRYKEDKTLYEGEEVIEQSGFNGCNSEAYRILRRNGEVVSEELLSRDTYDAMERIVLKGTKKKPQEKPTVPVNTGKENTGSQTGKPSNKPEEKPENNVTVENNQTKPEQNTTRNNNTGLQ